MDFTIDPDTVAIAEAVLRFVERSRRTTGH